MAGISKKELGFISRLELKRKYYFSRNDIRIHFRSDSELNVYIYRLRKKGRIVKLNRDKYFLVPVKAVKNKWVEHPFIVIDEMMNSKDYCIVGKAAANFWKLIDQIPFEYEVYAFNKKPKIVKIFNFRVNIKRRRKENMPNCVSRKIYGHQFIIAAKKESEKWS